jgi:hypothetical protein
MSADPRPTRCVVVVPVKPPALGKSRLVGLTDEQRRELAALAERVEELRAGIDAASGGGRAISRYVSR